uniref:Interleukin family protein n=1 Tax=Geotrypetes seraphini TaxID=260995 RepID=A0A6P8PIK9_GEOSA|nr:interleukin-20-like [Geotrypetes seraphini]
MTGIAIHMDVTRGQSAAGTEGYQTKQSLDSSSSLRIIDRSCLQDIAPSEQCCILRLLLNFYLGKVFRHCESVDPLLRRNIGVIANSFLSIKRELRICQAETRCVCRRQSRLTCQTIQENFEKMDISTAVLKALGELDILLDWMERIR